MAPAREKKKIKKALQIPVFLPGCGFFKFPLVFLKGVNFFLFFSPPPPKRNFGFFFEKIQIAFFKKSPIGHLGFFLKN